MILFTDDEIQEILSCVSKQSFLKGTGFLNILDRRQTAIFRISPLHGLIFVRGNSDTGWTHIFNRHSHGIEFENEDPSRFRDVTVPFAHYPEIADSIFVPENINTENNKAPEKFDLYIGKHKFWDEVEEEYKLILYKGTKIVHNLFPKTRRNNKRKKKRL